MTELDGWLKQATRHLSKDSAAQVRTEIEQHYESAREAALSSGGPADEAARQALAALGDAKTANRQYRRVLLTCSEARMLGTAAWEARAVCSNLWLKRVLLAIPVAALFGAATLFLAGDITTALAVLLVGLLATSPFLPVYTRARGRVFRYVRWVVMLGAFGLAFAPNTLSWSWLIFSCLGPMLSIEWTRASIRRKLPIAKWPKALYL
jgi:hypothetical protein